MNQTVLAIKRASPVSDGRRELSLGRHLIEAGLITPSQLFEALERQLEWDATLPEILLAEGWVQRPHLLQELAVYYTAMLVDLEQEPPDKSLADVLPPEICLKYNVLPWQSVGGLLIMVTGRPDRFDEGRAHMPSELRGALMAVSDEDAIVTQITETHREPLTELAESRVDQEFSCRGWDRLSPNRAALLWLGIVGLFCFVLFLPKLAAAVFTGWAVLSLIAISTIKFSAFTAHFLRPVSEPVTQPTGAVLPRISVMVPLFKENEIATALIARLARLTYPKALLDVVLVLEEHDELTHRTVACTELPGWMRVVTVPAGSGLTTKPRALNYALDHCKGDIIGIWDAEDAPCPDQLEAVAARFAQSPPEVACLQGVLDYYNPWTNWLSRCFTIEYATWFRVVLPGLARMGMVIPLGGTTLFLRRRVIEQLGGWDAHNVTEDADLGVRMARFGYRTELLTTVTQEEANCRLIPWVKQRSRWLKGYMATYLVHMQNPAKLWSDLGFLGFLGVQLVFLCTLSQFLLAPLIWSFWGGVIGVQFLTLSVFTPASMAILVLIMVASGVLNALIAAKAVSGQGRGAIFPFVLTMPLYFPLASLAGYKALFELVFRPYYWDKTAHAKTKEGTDAHHSGVGVLLEAGDKSL